MACFVQGCRGLAAGLGVAAALIGLALADAAAVQAAPCAHASLRSGSAAAQTCRVAERHAFRRRAVRAQPPAERPILLAEAVTLRTPVAYAGLLILGVGY